MNIILIDENYIAIGDASLWALYDQKNNVLAEQGSVVRDEEHLNNLLAHGVNANWRGKHPAMKI